jgi:hypothetical protein
VLGIGVVATFLITAIILIFVDADDNKQSFKEITYQGCQYLIVNQGKTIEHIIHKGNCPNHK